MNSKLIQQSNRIDLGLIARMDVYFQAQAIFFLAYFKIQRTPSLLIMENVIIAFPIIMIILAGLTIYDGCMRATLSLHIKKRIIVPYAAVNEIRPLLLTSMSWIAIMVPTLIIILWSFVISEFGIGSLSYVLPSVFVGEALVICVVGLMAAFVFSQNRTF